MSGFAISFTGDSKLALMHGLGCLLTLRRANVLYQCKILSGTGVGNLLLGFLARAFKLALDRISASSQYKQKDRSEQVANAWLFLAKPQDEKEDEDFFTRELVDRVFLFCARGVDGDAILNRLHKPRQWTQPWFLEIEQLIDQEEFSGVKMSDILLSRVEEEGPIFLFNGRLEDGMVSFTNVFGLQQNTFAHSPFARFVDLTTGGVGVSEVVTACGLPLAYGAKKELQRLEVSSSVESDPFGLAGLRVLCMKVHLDPDHLILVDGLSDSLTAQKRFQHVARQQIRFQLNHLMGPTGDATGERVLWKQAFGAQVFALEDIKHNDHDPQESRGRHRGAQLYRHKEELRLWRKQAVQMIDPIYKQKDAQDNDCSYLLELLEHHSESSLRSVVEFLLIHTVNLAACITAKYLGINPQSSKDVFINSCVTDEFNIFYSVFESCPAAVPYAKNPSTLEVHTEL